MDKLFDLVLGLPVHPLIIHVVVVFLPLFSLALIALFIFKPLREKYGLIVQIGLGIAFVSSFIAEQSGEALSLRVGTPIKHADLGEKLVPLAFALFVSSLIWFYLQRNSKKFNDLFINIFGIISVVLAIASIVMTYLVGHSGAEASWKERIAPKKVTQENTTQNSTSERNSSIVLNIEEVSKHNNPNDCWTVINNEVYNLTSYLKSHPGGEPNILRLCGIDGSSLFASQHGNEGSPNRQLSNLVIGNLGETIAEIPTMTSQNMDKQNKQENEGDED
jgi:cytochrome b involved in lipid metabolism